MTFAREERYIVIKKRDIEAIGGLTRAENGYLHKILSLLPNRQYVVVESDWPEYETVWKMIEDRVTES